MADYINQLEVRGEGRRATVSSWRRRATIPHQLRAACEPSFGFRATARQPDGPDVAKSTISASV